MNGCRSHGNLIRHETNKLTFANTYPHFCHVCDAFSISFQCNDIRNRLGGIGSMLIKSDFCENVSSCEDRVSSGYPFRWICWYFWIRIRRFSDISVSHGNDFYWSESLQIYAKIFEARGINFISLNRTHSNCDEMCVIICDFYFTAEETSQPFIAVQFLLHSISISYVEKINLFYKWA